ncbi:hypothetical protein BT96DRAFT_69367 [Gymnopus androsaceus JB14]|uniref:Uncharacterized protein n=1 Tax=Gymnopus androsaceus JB14 TaxID=1447944 RepID=A0A6A4HJ86_9AGAR|nr:hypothetical protein BT96DRAFT_69367 [Gymnopus androsaceus JB14]
MGTVNMAVTAIFSDPYTVVSRTICCTISRSAKVSTVWGRIPYKPTIFTVNMDTVFSPTHSTHSKVPIYPELWNAMGWLAIEFTGKSSVRVGLNSKLNIWPLELFHSNLKQDQIIIIKSYTVAFMVVHTK